jgi:lipopolysaccharide export system permease protein
VVPKSKASSVQLIYDQAARDPDSLLKPGVVQGNFKGKGGGIQKVLIEDRSAEWVEGFHYHQQANGADADRTYVHAARAALAIDAEKNQLRVKLEDAFFMTYRADGKDEMAFAGEAEPLLIDLNDSRSKKLRPSEMTNLEIQQRLANATDLDDKQRLKLKSEVTKRYSFSMACLAFAFIAVPLGLNSRRRETSGGLVLSLLIGTAYFLVTVLAKQFDSEAVTSAVLWAPNMACVLLGLIFFRRARFR